MPTTRRVYLVIGADKSVRAARQPRIGRDEVAIGINLTFPDGWGHVVGELAVNVPDFAPNAEMEAEDDDE